MAKADFQHVQNWVFDLDNTLYPREVRLFDQIEQQMAKYVMELLGIDHDEANSIRKDYWKRYGTTLAGLIAEHHIDPDYFLDYVHDIDFSLLRPDRALAQRIAALSGRKIVYTNGSARYARHVLRICALEDVFENVYGIDDAAYRPKPTRIGFEKIFAQAAIAPDKGAMFDDEVRNLKVPFALQMQTIHVAKAPVDEEFITHHTSDLKEFLHSLA